MALFLGLDWQAFLVDLSLEGDFTHSFFQFTSKISYL